jgi:hypothetical protein
VYYMIELCSTKTNKNNRRHLRCDRSKLVVGNFTLIAISVALHSIWLGYVYKILVLKVFIPFFWGGYMVKLCYRYRIVHTYEHINVIP